jgi:hypothetical protein
LLRVKIAFSDGGFEKYGEYRQRISIGALRVPVAEHRVFAEREKKETPINSL